MTVPIPLDGRLTSLSLLSGPLTGLEVMYIVSPGNAALGNSYQVTLDVLSTFFSASGISIIEITSGATIISPYLVLATAGRVLFNKAVGSASYTVCPNAATMVSEEGVWFKDLKGDANINPITISFSLGQLCDGLPQVVIDTPYGFIRVSPTPNRTGWYQL